MRRIAKLKITRTRSQTIETRPSKLRALCSACGREVEILTRNEAAGILEVDGRALDGFIACGRIHAIQTVSGIIRVCKESLFAK